MRFLTRSGCVETLHQLWHTICEETLAEHETHLSMTALAQYISRIGHEQGKAIAHCRAKNGVPQKLE